LTLIIQEVERFAMTYDRKAGVAMLVLTLKGQQNASAFAMETDLAHEIGKSLIDLPRIASPPEGRPSFD